MEVLGGFICLSVRMYHLHSFSIYLYYIWNCRSTLKVTGRIWFWFMSVQYSAYIAQRWTRTYMLSEKLLLVQKFVHISFISKSYFCNIFRCIKYLMNCKENEAWQRSVMPTALLPLYNNGFGDQSKEDEMGGACGAHGGGEGCIQHFGWEETTMKT
jgi:hypothetical protein